MISAVVLYKRRLIARAVAMFTRPRSWREREAARAVTTLTWFCLALIASGVLAILGLLPAD
jgi:hypothetical protein